MFIAFGLSISYVLAHCETYSGLDKDHCECQGSIDFEGININLPIPFIYACEQKPIAANGNNQKIRQRSA